MFDRLIGALHYCCLHRLNSVLVHVNVHNYGYGLFHPPNTQYTLVEQQGRLLSAHARKTFLLLPFCECIARSVVFGAIEFDN